MNSCFDSMFFHIAIVATTTGSNIAQGDLPSGPGPVLRVRCCGHCCGRLGCFSCCPVQALDQNDQIGVQHIRQFKRE